MYVVAAKVHHKLLTYQFSYLSFSAEDISRINKLISTYINFDNLLQMYYCLLGKM